MSFSGVFSIGLSGLNAFATSLQAVSDNIANSQTVGFKRARANFADLVTVEAAGTPTPLGTGVSAVNRQLMREQGALTRTASETDLAISGAGFFVVSETADGATATAPFLFTRSGGFVPNANGDLVNGAGYFLRGASIGANGVIPSSFSLAALETVNINRIPGLAAATTFAALAGNLDPNSPLSPALATYNPADPAVNMTSGAIAADFAQSFQIFDADGNGATLTLAFLRAGADRWNVEASVTPDGGTAGQIAAGVLAFHAAGDIDAGATTFPSTLSTGFTGAPVALDLGGLKQLAGTTRVFSANADGAAFGALSGVEVGDNGLVTALFENGLKRDIYQLPLALFINPEGLENAAASAFLSTPDAGDIRLARPADGPAGLLEAQALEISTVDIGQEFSTLIATQRAYSANARIITIADELWRTLAETAA